MKKLLFAFVGFLTAVFFLSSCSTEETNIGHDPDNLTALSFSALVADLTEKSAIFKQSIDDLPDCSDDDPAYVRIQLSSGDSDVVGSPGNPFRIDLVDGQTFTEEAPELELAAGTYSLDYFAVYNDSEELLWVAPTSESFSAFVDDPLPLEISLGAGVKKSVEVEVLCFDNRFVNEYGYIFFDIEPVELVEICLYGNYCDEGGRHFPAAFEVDVWKYEEGQQGEQLIEDLVNQVILDVNGDFTTSPACIFLPDGTGLDEFYFEISLLSSNAYGEVEEGVIRSGVISDLQVRELFEGANGLEFYHFREGVCELDDEPILFDKGNTAITHCTTINFEDLASQSEFTADYYAYQGVTILAGPDYPENAMKIMGGTCSANVLHSLNYPFASVLFNFSMEVISVSLEAGDYGEDQDTIKVTAYSGLDGTGEVLDTQTRILEENAGGCLPFLLETEGIRSVVVFGQSSRPGNNNTIFTDNLSFCRKI